MARTASNPNLTTKQLAKLAGVTIQRIKQYLKDNPSAIKQQGGGTRGATAYYDLADAARWLKERHFEEFRAAESEQDYAEPEEYDESAPGEEDDYSFESNRKYKAMEQKGKALKVMAEAGLKEGALRIQQGEYGEIEVLTAVLAIVGKKIRNQLEGLPNRIKARHENIPADVIMQINSEIAESMTDLASLGDDWVELRERAIGEE